MKTNKKLSQLAALLCKDEKFRVWLDRRRAFKAGIEVPDGTHTEEDARQFILDACFIKSRSELDTNELASSNYKFIYKIQKQYWERNRYEFKTKNLVVRKGHNVGSSYFPATMLKKENVISESEFRRLYICKLKKFDPADSVLETTMKTDGDL